MSAPAETILIAETEPVQVVWIGLPDPNAGLWAGLAIGLILLAAVAALTLVRARRAGTQAPQRSTRIYRTAFAFAGALTAMSAPRQIMLSTSDPPAIAALFATFVGLALAAMVLLGLADHLFGLLRPHRSLRWLLLAPPLFIFYAGTILTVFAPAPELSLPQAMLALSLAAAAMIWWSDLPAPDGDAPQGRPA